MSHPIKQHTKKLSYQDNANDNRKTIEAAGTIMSQSSVDTIKDFGDSLLAEAATLNSKVIIQENAHDAAETSTANTKEENKKGCELFNSIGDKVEELYPNEPNKWKELGLAVTEGTAHDKKPPEMVTEATMKQGVNPGECEIHLVSPENAQTYTVEISTSEPSDASKYIQVKNPRMFFSTSNFTIIVPDDYLDKALWVKLTAHNSAGDSHASDPFGGKKIL